MRQVGKGFWVLVVLLSACGMETFSPADTARSSMHPKAALRWSTVNVTLPVSDESFPPGEGADAAGGYCLICHSAGMVLRQPSLTRAEWHAEIMKMRSAYGAPVPDDQVERLVDYLAGLVKKQ